MRAPAFAPLLAIAAALPSSSAAENWPQFRGAGGAGLSKVAAPTTWNVESRENIRWSVEIPGLGHASPIVWGPHVFLATADRPGPRPKIKTGVYGAGESFSENEPHQWRLLCLDRETGLVRWNKIVHEAVPRQERHTKASHCNATPATDGRSIVAILGSEGVFCFEMDGTLRWKRDLARWTRGRGTHPSCNGASPVRHCSTTARSSCSAMC